MTSVEDYVYDTEGRVSSSTLTLSSRPNNPQQTSYLYDTLSRVTEARYPAQYGLAGNPRKVVQYTYCYTTIFLLKPNSTELFKSCNSRLPKRSKPSLS